MKLPDAVLDKLPEQQRKRAARRDCGKCDLCCTIMKVDDLDKPGGQRCPHQRKGKHTGCGIYGSRPVSCRQWFCAWRLGFGPEKSRPDQVGVILNFEREAEDSNGNTVLFERFDGYFPRELKQKWIWDAVFPAIQCLVSGG